MNKEEWVALATAVGLTVVAVVMSFFAPTLAHGDDGTVIVQVHTSPESAAVCKDEGGCTLVSRYDLQRLRALGALDVTRRLDKHGCLKDVT